MKKSVLGLMAALLVASLALAGCGSSKQDSAIMRKASDASEAKAKTESVKATADQVGAVQNEGRGDVTTTSADGNSIAGSSEADTSGSNAILSQRKVIRNANVTVEVNEFDTAYSKVKSMIAAWGYIQESSIKNEKVYAGSEEKQITRATIVLRVDSTRFEKILDGIGSLGTLEELNIGSEDVTEKFYDVESELRLLKYEQQRLEEYLKRISDPDTIFKTEARLTEIRHKIEGLTGTLNKLSDLVKLSTINLNINEKYPDDGNSKAKKDSYFERLSGRFVKSIKGVVSFVGEAVIFLAEALPVLVVLGLLAGLVILAYKKFHKKN